MLELDLCTQRARAAAGYMPRQHPERTWSFWGAQPQPQCVSAACNCSLQDARRSPPAAKSPPSLGILAWLEKPRFRRNLVRMASWIHLLGRKTFGHRPVPLPHIYGEHLRKTHLSPRKTHFGVCPRTVRTQPKFTSRREPLSIRISRILNKKKLI